MLTISKWIIYFIIYSFIGWLMEVSICLIRDKRFINRGFLIGPICPIYGYGILFIIFFVHGSKSDILSVFLKSILVCSLLEYYTSYVMEKLFKARWWDYSTKKYNINGRICLETMVPFGILGSVFVLLIHPINEMIVNSFNSNFIIVLGIVFLILYLVDNIISFNVMSKIKHEIKQYSKDSTEVIRKKITEWLSNNTYLFKHIFNAFPRFSIISKVKDKVLK